MEDALIRITMFVMHECNALLLVALAPSLAISGKKGEYKVLARWFAFCGLVSSFLSFSFLIVNGTPQVASLLTLAMGYVFVIASISMSQEKLPSKVTLAWLRQEFVLGVNLVVYG